MATVKPTVDPKWATNNVPTDNIEPTAALKDGGIVDGAVIGREHFNWQFNSIGQWIDWVRAAALDKDSNLVELTDKNAARTNLGLNVGTTTLACNTSGNAGTATKLATPRTIGISGDITATAKSFDGSANIIISASVNNDSHSHSDSTVSLTSDYIGAKFGNTLTTLWSGRAESSITFSLTESCGNFRWLYIEVGPNHADSIQGNLVNRVTFDGNSSDGNDFEVSCGSDGFWRFNCTTGTSLTTVSESATIFKIYGVGRI